MTTRWIKYLLEDQSLLYYDVETIEYALLWYANVSAILSGLEPRTPIMFKARNWFT